MEIKRYDINPLYMHYYMYPLYILPIILAITDKQKAVTIAMLFLSGIMYLSIFWTEKSYLFQCCKRSIEGKYILHKKSLCKLNDNIFFSQRQQYMLIKEKPITGYSEYQKIKPRLDFTFKEALEGVIHPFYDIYPINEFKIPNPSFFQLFKEQCVTPLFCFQVFSSLLLCFDEYVLQSLFSTGMLVSVEAFMVFSRTITMKMFRKMEHKEIQVKIISKAKKDSNFVNPFSIKEKATETSSINLKPGDYILIESAISIPCDLLILEGSCAANESMLSGESIPLFKEPITESFNSENISERIFDIKKDKKHVLFAGTSVEKIYKNMVCLVLRTSFNTEQGILLNKMLQSEDIKYDPEALKFILILTFISLLSSVVTFFFSKKKGYALFIDIIILFTNSIPFELPMEMGMSVQNAVKNLISLKIYCLEPFRIVLAGKVNVCCFDKTGTLTNSELEMKGMILEQKESAEMLSLCNNLIMVNNEIRGDPLDISIHKFTKREICSAEKVFSFSSELRRMGVITRLENKRIFILKGAPETIRKFLKNKPDNYLEYEEYARKGYRVIALAYKYISTSTENRNELEREMSFGGFALFGSSLKDYSREMCKILKDSNHKIIIITGDNLNTAKNIAEQLSLDTKGAEGKQIDEILGTDEFFNVNIFARADPKHKEMIINAYKEKGDYTMMVGDGTNDVGALKAADVGIAILDTPAHDLTNRDSKKDNLKDFANNCQNEVVKPGDASVAAPFTVKSNSLKSIIEIIQQGRSSLVTTIQMYKILALNSIINAVFCSLVDVLGVKFSEIQMVSLGILSSLAFSAISNSKTLPTISKQRPLTGIFNLYIMMSIVGQSIVHIISCFLIYRYVPNDSISEKFNASVINTSLYLISAVHTISNFLNNYIGRPFREDLSENKILGLSLGVMAVFIANIFLKFNSDLNEYLGIVDISSVGSRVLGIVIFSTVFSYVAERVCFNLFLLD
jgi:manganese-transporting P-type ATPase